MNNVFLPVIHYLDGPTALRNAEIAGDAGADGVLLISMNGRDRFLDGPAVEIKKRFPGFLVGTNRLSLSPEEAIAHDALLGLRCFWSDRCGICNGKARPEAEKIARTIRRLTVPGQPPLRFLASVAFKYQEPDADPPASAAAVVNMGWIPVTSGPATGSPPDPSKIAAMREAIGPGAKLGIASGMTPDNVPAFLPYADTFLVSTGISLDFHRLDPAKTRAFSEAVRTTG